MMGLQDLLAPYQGVATGQVQDPLTSLSGQMGMGSGLLGMIGGVMGQQSNQGGGGGGGSAPGTANHWEQVASQMAQRKYGWGPDDFKYIDWIISGGGPKDVVAESHWDPNAVNPNGGASGIPQMLPSAHPDINLQQFRSNPMMQIRWLLNYVKGRYGDPQSAYQAKAQQGWY